MLDPAPALKCRARGRIEQTLLDGDAAPTDLRPSHATPLYHKKLQMFLSTTKGRNPALKLGSRLGRSGCYSPRCLILCAVVALMCLRARGGRSSITRWSSASVSRTSTHSSAYCASLASPISSICPSLSSIALLWLGVGIPRRMPRLPPCAPNFGEFPFH